MELTTDQTIGANVRAARVNAGITQQGDLVPQLREAGLSWTHGTLSRVESGQRVLKFSEAAVLADVLGVPLDALVDPAADKFTPDEDTGWEALVFAERLANLKRTVDNEYREAVARAGKAIAESPALRERVQVHRDRYLATERERARRDAGREGVDVHSEEDLNAYMARWGHHDVPVIRAATDALGDGAAVLGETGEGC
ncbi:helix-turn-helix domain-containing protein [Micrococcus luteus]|uniref:helix-turn-helix domain-containing protein n=1 Tax=Micrococcus luteus TaxID=1270 RepID=UPI0038186421